MNASMSALASFIMAATFGKLPAGSPATVSHWARQRCQDDLENCFATALSPAWASEMTR